ncbi:DUF1707 domain-containing protein [Agromyces sp. Leaf222]|uniref:DUF1707 SHOCT-like domain-containing protein n=1 Tax=Agromyces sp. Leaf222 TaxID=1735688 RepID=UPI0006FF602F|nr:DUF1707 domain-containing protein [Agromyces sp. Leaf222]KQM82209.1 hypothetical protein ASE68_01950 [Agromyces sp. Leaf222]
MSDQYATPEQPDLRLSDAERERAVARLADAHAAGRLSAVEYGERAASARSAVTRSDLVPLFADLPAETPPAPGSPGAAGAAGAAGAPYGGTEPVGRPATFTDPDLEPAGQASGRSGSRALGGGVGATIMALVPFIALILFLVSGFLGGWAWAWLWWLLVPIAGIIIYGPGADERRRR